MPRVPHPVALAARMDLPKVRWPEVLENEAGCALLPKLSAVCFGYGGHSVRRHAQAVATLVRSDVACHQPEIWSQRVGPSANFELRQLSHSLELAAQTAAAMVRPGRDRLSGMVEVDEIFIGGERSGKRGRGAAGKALVLIAAQAAGKGIGRIRLARVTSASGDNLCPAVTQAVEVGSTVCTDGWKGYNGLRDLGYKHETIRPTPALGDNLLPLANRVASLLKRWLLGTHQGAVQPSHLDYYLDEFTFRFNRRTSGSRGLLFYRLVDQAVHLQPVRAGQLKGEADTVSVE